MLFAPGSRPDISAITELSLESSAFSISFDPTSGSDGADPCITEQIEACPNRWVELLANGLTFDLAGLEPGPPTSLPEARHRYGLATSAEGEGVEAITLGLGPHIADGQALFPVVRSLARLTAHLAALPNVRAIVWHPAACWSAPQQFRSSVLSWTEGGPFPMFSLAGLTLTPDDQLVTEGLALFTGQEMRMGQDLEKDVRGTKTALRLAHWLVEHGRLTESEVIKCPDGRAVRLRPSSDYRLVNVEQV